MKIAVANFDVSSEYVTRSRGNAAVLPRFIALAMLSAVSSPADAGIREVSPEVIACQNEATARYIADFRQAGLPHERFEGFPVVVTVFKNDTPRFEEYVAECMKRWIREKIR
jgi:hypothetical protein